MKISIIPIALLSVMQVNGAIATCRDKNNVELDVGYLECVKAGYKFSDSFDELAFSDMSGGWATNCRDKSIRVRIVRSDRGIIARRQTLDGDPGVEWSIVSIKHMGATYYINYSDESAMIYRTYIFTLLPGPTVQLVNMSQLKDGIITDDIIAGRNVNTGKALPQLNRCEP